MEYRDAPEKNTSMAVIPPGEPESEYLTDLLLVEVAMHLYEQGWLSVGKAHELAGLSLWEFRQLLGLRRVAPRFEAEDLKQDLLTLRHLGVR